MPTHRIERDALGEVSVPCESYYGASTARSLTNCRVRSGRDIMPIELIHTLALFKRVAAELNRERKLISDSISSSIIQAANEVYNGDLDGHFPLVIWQTGSGTQTNMNVNEVIANRSAEILGGKRGDNKLIHPYNHVNLGQSSNDIFPSAINVSVVLEIVRTLLPSLEFLIRHLNIKENEFMFLVKLGRTHMQDAVPLTVGQEISGYTAQLKKCYNIISHEVQSISQLAVGGTAVGTGLNTYKDYDILFCKKLTNIISEILRNEMTVKFSKAPSPAYKHWKPTLKLPNFKPAPNKFAALSGQDSILIMSGCFNTLAAALTRLANDFRLLSSGPRCGLGEFVLPSNDIGSSIMPGKINPTQCEAMNMVCAQVMGNHLSTTIGASQGQLELNCYLPLLAANMLRSVVLLADSCRDFAEFVVYGLKMNTTLIAEHLKNSLMLVTALSPFIGHDKAAESAIYAHKNNLTLREAIITKGFLRGDEYDDKMDPLKMAFPFGLPREKPTLEESNPIKK